MGDEVGIEDLEADEEANREDLREGSALGAAVDRGVGLELG